MIVSVSHIQKAFDTKEVLQDVSFHLEAKEKASLIGINGAGKTTLFQILLGRLSPDDGEVYLQKNLNIGYLPQIAEYESANRIEEELLTVFDHLRQMEKEMRLRLKMSLKYLHHIVDNTDKSCIFAALKF